MTLMLYTERCEAVREVPKDVLKMASGLISPSGHRGQLCTAHLSLVNSLGLDTDQGGSLVAFYPVFSNINHACLANTKPVKVTIQLIIRS